MPLRESLRNILGRDTRSIAVIISLLIEDVPDVEAVADSAEATRGVMVVGLAADGRCSEYGTG